MNLASDTNTNSMHRPRNPWTGELLPPLPYVRNPDNWIFKLLDDGAMFNVYSDNDAPISFTFDVHVFQDVGIEVCTMSWTNELLDLKQLEQDAVLLPAWIKEIQTVSAWTHAAFPTRSECEQSPTVQQRVSLILPAWLERLF